MSHISYLLTYHASFLKATRDVSKISGRLLKFFLNERIMTQNQNLHTDILTDVCVSLNPSGHAKNVLSVCVLTVKSVQILSLPQC